MSFASPAFLAALALVPLIVAAYIAERRRRRRYAVRFTAMASLREAVKPLGPLRRHLPAALALAAVTLLVFSIAKPQRTIAVPIEDTSIMLVTDHSRSMDATDVDPTRLDAAKSAARDFLDKVPDEVKLGVVAFSTSPDAVQAPTQDHDSVKRLIDDQIADGATATGDALQVALELLKVKNAAGIRPPSAIVLLSDGKTTTGRDPVGVAREAGDAKIPIYTISLGTEDGVVQGGPFGGPLIPVPPDPDTMHAIAQSSRGRAYTAEDESRLSDIYSSLGSRLGTRQQKQEISSTFALGGLLLMIGAAMGSVRWSGRLP